MRPFLRNVEENLVGLMLAVICILIFVDVLTRYAIAVSSAGIEEISIIIFIYTVFFGATVATKKEMHIVVDSLHRLMPARAQVVMSLATEFLSLLFFVIMTFAGVKLTIAQWLFTSPTYEVPMSLFSLPVPVCSALMSIYTIFNIKRRLTENK